jgi:hypothetical protein
MEVDNNKINNQEVVWNIKIYIKSVVSVGKKQNTKEKRLM